MKLANIFTIIACRIINATCRCIDRGCEARVREKNYYHHNLCSIFSRNNTEDENGGERRRRRRKHDASNFSQLQHDVHSLMIFLSGVSDGICFQTLTLRRTDDDHTTLYCARCGMSRCDENSFVI